MEYRSFGRTGLRVSELSFGGWAIGGRAYGPVTPDDALRALSRAEELGVNLVDTAAVYGGSEAILGRFLKGRRERWLVSSKYSGQPEGLIATAESQLRRMGISWIDFYQLHWVPNRAQAHLYDQLRSLKESGKARYVGVSLYSASDIDSVVEEPWVDGFQVAFGLLDPHPLLLRAKAVQESGRAVIARSCLKGGFLTGKYSGKTSFSEPTDQRSGWDPRKIAETAAAADRFRFLEARAGSMLNAAVSYPLSFPIVSTVLLSTKNEHQSALNFGQTPTDLGAEALGRISAAQRDLGLMDSGLVDRIRRILRQGRNLFNR